jgi:hypothetical protein
VLARHLNVSYFSNLTDLFPLQGAWLSRRLRGWDQRPPARYGSYYGVARGLAAPSDAFGVWNRWLGHNRYGAPAQIDAATQAEMHRFFDRWRRIYPQPFLNKNNRNVDCAVALSQVFPEAFFVEMRRNPVEVAASLLRAREIVQGERRYPWGLHSDRFTEDPDPAKQVCRQVCSVLDRLDGARASIGERRYLQVDLARFREQPAQVVSAVHALVPGLQLRPGTRLDRLQPFRRSPAPGDDIDADRLRELLAARQTAPHELKR